MERLKTLEEVLRPDSRNGAFAKIDLETNEIIPMRIEDYHRGLSTIVLKDQVPDDVRSYFETVKHVCLYGWFVYPFFTLSTFLSFTVIEMALRKRFEKDSLPQKWGLKDLLQEAKKRSLISDEGFSRPRMRREEYYTRLDGELGSSLEQPVADYTSILVESLPYLRNRLAHPTSQMILMPGDAVASLAIAAELINQLF